MKMNFISQLSGALSNSGLLHFGRHSVADQQVASKSVEMLLEEVIKSHPTMNKSALKELAWSLYVSNHRLINQTIDEHLRTVNSEDDSPV